jgi:ADP-ribose pyrophosphatase YjhB (NUDIX family)
VEPREDPASAALRELREECHLEGRIVRQTSHIAHSAGDETYTFLVEIGDLEPEVGGDPELPADEQILCDVAWMRLEQIPERDRAFLWGRGSAGRRAVFGSGR